MLVIASITDYFCTIWCQRVSEQPIQTVCGYNVYKDVWDPQQGNDFTTKHDQNNPHDKLHCGSATSGLPQRDRISMENEQAVLLGYLPRQCPTVLLLFASTDRTTTPLLVVRVVSLLLCGEAIAQVGIPHILVNVVATYDTKFPLIFHHLGIVRVDPVLL